jgi:hypothetical protein
MSMGNLLLKVSGGGGARDSIHAQKTVEDEVRAKEPVHWSNALLFFFLVVIGNDWDCGICGKHDSSSLMGSTPAPVADAHDD